MGGVRKILKRDKMFDTKLSERFVDLIEKWTTGKRDNSYCPLNDQIGLKVAFGVVKVGFVPLPHS